MIKNQTVEENEMKEIKKSIAKEREMKQKELLKYTLDNWWCNRKWKEKHRNIMWARKLKQANSTSTKRGRFQIEQARI